MDEYCGFSRLTSLKRVRAFHRRRYHSVFMYFSCSHKLFGQNDGFFRPSLWLARRSREISRQDHRPSSFHKCLRTFVY